MPAVVLTMPVTCTPAEVSLENTESARLLPAGSEIFSIRRTDHFVIASDGDAGVVNRLADRLEATYQAVARFARDLTSHFHPPPDLLPVIYFNRHSDFVRYAQAAQFNDPAAPGFYDQDNNMAAFCNILDLPKVREISERIDEAEARGGQSATPEQIAEWKSQRDALVEASSRLVIQHEAAHLVLFNTGVLSRDADNPDWLVEGLACQFEGTVPGAVNQTRLADFREALGASRIAVAAEASNPAAPRTANHFLSVNDLVADDKFNATDEATRTFRYAQAWALVHFLKRSHSEAFATYLRRIAAYPPNKPNDRQQRITEFQLIFGILNMEFQERWLESIFKLPPDSRP